MQRARITVLALLAVLAYLLFDRAAQWLSTGGADTPLLWPSGGFALALVLVGGPRWTVAVFVGELLARCLTGMPPNEAMVPALSAAGGPLLAASVLGRFPEQPFPRMRVPHYSWFLAACVLDALICSLPWALPDYLLAGTRWNWSQAVAAHVAGTLMIVPLVLSWREQALALAELRQRALWLALPLGVVVLIFMLPAQVAPAFLLLLPALLVWTALQLELRWISVMLLLLGLAGWLGHHLKASPLGLDLQADWLLLWQGLLISIAVTTQSLSIAMHERATARRRAERRESQLLQLLEGSIQGVFVHRQFRPIYLNRRTAELLGYESVQAVLQQDSLQCLIVPEDLPRVLNAESERRLKAGEALSLRFDVCRPDGERRTLDSISRLVSWNGETAVQATFIDVTEDVHAQREQQAQLRRHRAQHAAVVRLGMDGALSQGLDGALALLTRSAAEALKTSRVSVWRLDEDRQELLCLDLHDSAEPPRADAPRAAGQVLEAGTYPHYFAALRTGQPVVAPEAWAHGATREFAAGYLDALQIRSMLDAPIFLEGRLSGVVCFEHCGEVRRWTRDEVRFAGEVAALAGRYLIARERRLLESLHARLSAILDATPDYVATCDGEQVLHYLNPAARRMLGVGENALSQHLSLRTLCTPAAMRRYLEVELPHLVEHGSWVGESVLRGGDGDIPVSVVRVVHRDEQGRVAFVSSVMRDIGEAKRAEQALREAKDTLEVRVAERTSELARANARLQELDRLKSMFIASMSHELRTPLNSIIGFTGVLLAGMSGDLNTRQEDQLRRVYNSSKHLLGLISDVIDISKIEAGFAEVFPENVDLSQLLHEAEAGQAASSREKGLTLRIEVAPGLHLFCDRQRLMQCVLNLLTNAIKYTEHGGVMLQAVRDGDWIEIAVSDTGIGIDAEGMDKLFQPFERIGSRLRVKTAGTGLGLYLTRKIATELLGGSVSVSSVPDQGSRFVLRLPLDGSFELSSRPVESRP